jgi:cytochrome c oxidase cbb3-type subunit 3
MSEHVNQPDAGDQPNFTGHEYDGIVEYDNPTPSWWTYFFLITVGFSAIYMFVTLAGGDQLSPASFYVRDATEQMKSQYGQLGDVKPDAKTILRLANDPKWVRVGESLFKSNCVSCHGVDGSGMTGPNLTDEAYLHVKKVDDLADVVINGRKNGAMPAWNQRLQPVEQVLVSSYVASLRGKNLPSMGNRPLEGDKPAPWSE